MKFGFNFVFDSMKLTLIDEDGYLIGLSFGSVGQMQLKETELIKKVIGQLTEYVEGKRKCFDVPIMMNGTKFQKKVWNELVNIPYGETRSYKQIAEKVGNPKACRAVGMANNRNPIGIIVPCHRVIGTNGNLVGYAGGVNIKSYLLDLEKKFK